MSGFTIKCVAFGFVLAASFLHYIVFRTQIPSIVEWHTSGQMLVVISLQALTIAAILEKKK